MSDPCIRRQTEQRLQLSHTDSQLPSGYWGKLSKIWLTKRALKELDRRNNKPNEHPPPYRQIRRPLTRNLLAKRAKRQWSAFKILKGFSGDDLKEVKGFARRGGPDTSDLRGYPEPVDPLKYSIMPPRKRLSVSKNKDAIGMVKIKTTSPYSRNFEQLLIDNGTFPAFHVYPDGRWPAEPNNLDEIEQRLKQRRPSLSPSRFTDKEFKQFQVTATQAKKEEQVTQSVIPIIEGNSREDKYVNGKLRFGNLCSLIDLTGDSVLTPGNPDLYDGARPELLDRRVRNRLKNMIIPTTQHDLPVAPNFFLHVKGSDGTEAVAARQCVYDGALGERGQVSLRLYGKKEPHFDNNAHTITSVYVHQMLSMYTVYAARTNGPKGRQEYYTHLIGSWAMNGNIQSFRDGAAAFRNLRDWAKEQRDEAITLANDEVADKKNLGEEDAELGVASSSTPRALSESVDS